MDVKTSSQEINKLIKSVKTYGDKYNNTVQAAIVAIVRHAKDYGDCTGAARLVAAMPRSNRRQLVIDHFTQYSPISVSREGKTGDNFKASLRKPENKLFNDFDIDGVKANNWFERPEAERLQDVINFDTIRSQMLAYFESLLKKADKCEDESQKDEAVAFIRAVRTAASEIVASNNNNGTKPGIPDPEEAYKMFCEEPRDKAEKVTRIKAKQAA